MTIGSLFAGSTKKELIVLKVARNTETHVWTMEAGRTTPSHTEA